MGFLLQVGSCGLAGLEMAGQSGKPALPELPVGRDPIRGFPHRPGVECTAARASLPRPVHEPRPLQHPQVFRNRRSRNAERRRQFPDRRFSFREALQDRPARRIGQSLEGRVQLSRIGNHMVTSNVVFPDRQVWEPFRGAPCDGGCRAGMAQRRANSHRGRISRLKYAPASPATESRIPERRQPRSRLRETCRTARRAGGSCLRAGDGSPRSRHGKGRR